MTISDYILDSTLVLLVLLQIRERELTTKSIVRPLVIVAVAVINYLHGIPTAGNDVVLIVLLATVGATIGAASGATMIMRSAGNGVVLARAGWQSGALWVLGMGARFAFVFWISHTGQAALGRFSASHAITSAEAWTVALLAMAVFEVGSRTVVLALRRRQLQGVGAPSFA